MAATTKDKATLRVEAADDLVSDVPSPPPLPPPSSAMTTYSLEPWRTYVPNFVVLCSTTAPVIVQSGAAHVSATQSASAVQLAIGFEQNMRLIVEREDIFCCKDSSLRDLTETRVSLGADEVDRVDPPLKSALNLNAVVVVGTSAAELLLARILREPPAAFVFVDLPEATITYSVISTYI
jgi:hypothetical protein